MSTDVKYLADMKHLYILSLAGLLGFAACASSEDAVETTVEERIPQGDLSPDFVVEPGEIKSTDEVVAQIEIEKEEAADFDIALTTDEIEIKIPTQDALQPDEMIAMVEQPNSEFLSKGEDGLSQMKLLTEMNQLRQEPQKYAERIQAIINAHPKHPFSSFLDTDDITQLNAVVQHLNNSKPLPGLYPTEKQSDSRARYSIDKQLSAQYNIIYTLATAPHWAELVKLDTRAMRVKEIQNKKIIHIW